MATLFIKTIKSDNICDNSALCVLRLSETEKLVGKGKRPIDVSTSEAAPRCHATVATHRRRARRYHRHLRHAAAIGCHPAIASTAAAAPPTRARHRRQSATAFKRRAR